MVWEEELILLYSVYLQMKAVPLRTMAMSSMKGQSGNCSSGGNSITSNPILRRDPTNSMKRIFREMLMIQAASF